MGLVGIKSDPIRSTEAILLSNIFEHYWRNGEDLDLPKLIMAIQEPPVRQIGVFDVDTFYPQKDRFGLAMAFNTSWPRPPSRRGWKANRWRSTASFSPRRASRATASSTSPT
ncbi:MAG: hypothetical protein R3A10_04530 [Caldilineaceae bacterium]